MKGFLFDENVPLYCQTITQFPVIPAVKIGHNLTDSQIWQFALRHDLAIVSKDADFSERIITETPPPRVVHLRIGNLRNKELYALLVGHWPQVERLLRRHKLVNVYADRLEGVG